MKQILQSLKNGHTEVVDVPSPQCKPGCVLVETRRSLISVGTERMLVSFGKSGWIAKAKQQPDKVKQVLQKIRTDGLKLTLEAVQNKLEQKIPMGYSNVGDVIAVGSGVTEFKAGDRVLSNGAHAEIICVPKNLCARVPDNVSDDMAVFGVLGAIALEGVRLTRPELGETIVVFGLGLLGLLTVQLLRANGCRVIGIDFDKEKLLLARQFGAEVIDLSAHPDPIQLALAMSQQRGVDAVLITASSKRSDIMHQAAQMSRKRGRIVLVGVVGLELSRADFYDKELTFQVSCSYGPGRYDKTYEEAGQDYPIGYVRWTEQRNFEAVLQLMADEKLNVWPLISHRFLIHKAAAAYDLLSDATKSPLGILIDYPPRSEKKTNVIHIDFSEYEPRKVVAAFIGAGSYASRILIPAFKQAKVALHTVISSGGVSAQQVAKKLSVQNISTDINAAFEDDDINTVVIATQHDTHADLICRALKAKKAVFVEKPLAINATELTRVMNCYQETESPFVMVGFNRRFSPLVKKMYDILSKTVESKVLLMTVNAGYIPHDHWTQDLKKGGGRIVGEACHMIDLLRYLVGAKIVKVQASAVGQSSQNIVQSDQVIITLNFEDGSLGTIHYLANGNKAVPKERLEVFCGGQVLQLNNFKSLRAHGVSGFKQMKLWSQNKGQNECVQATVHALEGGLPSPIPFNELVEVTQATFDVMDIIST